jgi:hypothetical protein
VCLCLSVSFCLFGSQSIFCAAVSIANVLFGHFVFVNPVAKKELSESGKFLSVCLSVFFCLSVLLVFLCFCLFVFRSFCLFVFSVFLVLNPFSVGMSQLQMFYTVTLSLSTLLQRKSLVNRVSFVYLCFCLSVFLSFLSFWFLIHFLHGCLNRKRPLWSLRLCQSCGKERAK